MVERVSRESARGRQRKRKTNLAGARSTLLDQVEAPELSETLQQLHDLIIRQITRQPSDEDLVDRVGDVGGDDSGDVRSWAVGIGSHVVLWPTDLKCSVLEDDAVEAEGVGRFVGVAELGRIISS